MLLLSTRQQQSDPMEKHYQSEIPYRSSMGKDQASGLLRKPHEAISHSSNRVSTSRIDDHMLIIKAFLKRAKV